MSEQKNSNNGGVVGCLVIVAVLLALALGGVGGVMLGDPRAQRSVTIYPDLPAPAPETLNYVPSVQTFAPVVDDCPDPSQPWAGWEDGIGGVLPACWTREQQNAYMRSH